MSIKRNGNSPIPTGKAEDSFIGYINYSLTLDDWKSQTHRRAWEIDESVMCFAIQPWEPELTQCKKPGL